MKHLKGFDKIPYNTDLKADINISKRINQLIHNSSHFSGYIFLLCIHGTCSISVNLNQYTMKKGTLLILLPDFYFQLIEQSDDCLFIFMKFSSEIVNASPVFTKIMEYTSFIYYRPIIRLAAKEYKLMYGYIKVIINARSIFNNIIPHDHAVLTFAQIFLVLGHFISNSKTINEQYNRNQEIVKELFSAVATNYKIERSVTFYADEMRLSSKYLSAIIKKATGKTISDIISSFIINDAKVKLKSTSMTVKEIAFSLNFPNISFFGKYFKRYTGMSPKQYRFSPNTLQI